MSSALYLPSPLGDPDGYRRLYESVEAVSDTTDLSDECDEIALPPDLSADQVYRLLPTAPDFEYGGYLTPASIRYLPCDEERAATFGG